MKNKKKRVMVTLEPDFHEGLLALSATSGVSFPQTLKMCLRTGYLREIEAYRREQELKKPPHKRRGL